MHTRTTSDYTPTRPGSGAENGAIVARREMIGLIGATPIRKEVRRKTWEERMAKKCPSFTIGADMKYRQRNGNHMKHKQAS